MEDIERSEDDMREVESVIEVEEQRIEEQEAEHDRHVRMVRAKGQTMSPDERARVQADVREAMAEVRASMREAREEMKSAVIEMRDSEHGMTRIEANCSGSDPVVEKTTKSGKKVTVICESAITANALLGLREARKGIAADKQLDAQIKAEVLRGLDEAIAEWVGEG